MRRRNNWQRGPETPTDALLSMDYDTRDRLPRWRSRALFPLTEGVSERWQGAGVDLTARVRDWRHV